MWTIIFFTSWQCSSLVFQYHSEDLWCSIAYFRKWVKIYQSTCRATPLPCSQNETASMVPNLKPPSLPKMKLPIGCPIWNPFKHEYYRFLSIHVSSNLPKIGRQCTPLPKEWTSWIQVKVTFWFWLTFGSGWHTSLEWKSWIQVKVTF